MNPVLYLLLPLGSALGGFVQAVTGFGTGIVLMLFLPYFMTMLEAPVVAAAITMAANVTLFWRYRKTINIKETLPPLISYMAASVLTINCLGFLKMDVIKLSFAVFLIAVACYYLFVPSSTTIKKTWYSALFCGAISGACSALFGIGGPLIALYFVSVTKDRTHFMGDCQFLFVVTGTVNLITRIAKGLYTVDMIPLILIGIVGIVVGKKVGVAVGDKLNAALMKKIVYLFVGVAGCITLIQALL